VTGRVSVRSDPAAGRVSVVVVDERPLVAAGLEALLSAHDLRVARIDPWRVADAPFGDGVALVCVGEDATAEVVGALVARGLRVVLYGTVDDTAAAVGVEAGAVGILDDGSLPEDLLAVVRRASTGLPLIDADERDRLKGHLRRVRARREPHGFRLLTARERQILGALMEGRRPVDIAAADFVSVTTVRNQVQSILTKLNAHSQLEAVALARRVGWRADADGEPRSLAS
jgi:two-component system, NarL family, nitrate/nitrite response regulator NarL